MIDQHGNVRVFSDLNTQNVVDNNVVYNNNDLGSSASSGENDNVSIADLFRTVISNQSRFAKKLISVEKGMQEMFSPINTTKHVRAN